VQSSHSAFLQCRRWLGCHFQLVKSSPCNLQSISVQCDCQWKLNHAKPFKWICHLHRHHHLKSVQKSLSSQLFELQPPNGQVQQCGLGMFRVGWRYTVVLLYCCYDTLISLVSSRQSTFQQERSLPACTFARARWAMPRTDGSTCLWPASWTKQCLSDVAMGLNQLLWLLWLLCYLRRDTEFWIYQCQWPALVSGSRTAGTTGSDLSLFTVFHGFSPELFDERNGYSIRNNHLFDNKPRAGQCRPQPATSCRVNEQVGKPEGPTNCTDPLWWVIPSRKPDSCAKHTTQWPWHKVWQDMTRLSVALPTLVTFHTKAWPRLFSWQQLDPLCLAFAYKRVMAVVDTVKYCLYPVSILSIYCQLLPSLSETAFRKSQHLVQSAAICSACTVLLLRSSQIYQTNTRAFPRLEDWCSTSSSSSSWRCVDQRLDYPRKDPSTDSVSKSFKKRSGRNTVFISDTIKVCVCVCYKYICILCIYTQRCVCVYVCVCVWFELHCTNTFSPAKGCLELVDSSQAPWHLAYCGEIVLLTHSGRTWQTSKSNQRIWDMWLNLKMCIFMISSWHFRGVHGIPKSRWVELDCNWLRLNLTLHTCIYDIQYTYHLDIYNYIY